MFPGIFAKGYDVSGLKCIFANGSGRVDSNLNSRLNGLFAYHLQLSPNISSLIIVDQLLYPPGIVFYT